MRLLVHQSEKGPITILSAGGGGLLILILALPLDAAPPKTKRLPTAHVLQAAAPINADRASVTASPDSDEPATIDVLAGVRTGRLLTTAEGIGDGRMTLSITNRTTRKLRVVLPPGLIATGASGQFGGMGMGMGGGMGGMGGGMGGMGGGMGMMGGGMGGMGGGMGGGMMGGRGGMMGGMGMGGGTMPSSMGMMMLGRLIMSLVGDRDSWDQRSLMMGMMGGGMGMMGGGMGGMGGGGMGGGMMGGMGGGFRSVPPTSPLETTLQPRQVRHLPTAVVSLNGPAANGRPVAPSKGEPLQISAIDDLTDDSRTRLALKRLAAAKAPPTIAQMVLWYVTAGADWNDVGRLSQGWGNAHEIDLARRFVARLEPSEAPPPGVDPGLLYWEIHVKGDHSIELVDGLRALWGKFPVLGLTAQEGIPSSPNGPALACRIELSDAGVGVKLSASHPSGTDWVAFGDVQIKASIESPESEPDGSTTETGAPANDRPLKSAAGRLGDAVAAGMLERLVRVRLVKVSKGKHKESYRIKIVNESPLILNGLALDGREVGEDRPPSVLAGVCLPPLKSMTVPATAEMVERLNLDEGMRVLAVDLSGL